MPALTVVPSKCKITYVITIPKAIKDIASVDDNGDIKIGGAAKPDMAGKYDFTVQAKSPKGVEIPGAKYTLKFTLVNAKKKEGGGELITTISTIGSVAATAASASAAARGPRGPRPSGPRPSPVKVDGGSVSIDGTKPGKPGGKVEGGGKVDGKGPDGKSGGGESFDVEGGGGAEGEGDFGGSDFGEGGEGGEGEDSNLQFEGVNDFDFSI